MALPRRLLFALCVLYIVPGLLGRDPWKNDDAAGFGLMWSMAHGSWHDWLLPNLAGRVVTEEAPLMFWLGAASIKIFGWLGGLLHFQAELFATRLVTGLLFLMTCAFLWYAAHQLARRPEAQPFNYAFGGHPSPLNYGRTLADGTLLIFLATLGLAARIHESTAEVAQLALLSMSLFGAARSLRNAITGPIYLGVGLGGLALASHPVLPAVVLLLFVLVACFSKTLRPLIKFWLGISLPLAALLAASWPWLALQLDPQAPAFLQQWWEGGLQYVFQPTVAAWRFVAKNYIWYSWPLWPLAVWAAWSWRDYWQAPHIALPLALTLATQLYLLLHGHAAESLFMMTVPGMAVLAAFALPTLKRGTVNAIDWFALMISSVAGLVIWVMWIAKMTGYPVKLANNLARIAPGYIPQFNLLTFLFAIAVTAAWFVIVHWRVSRHPKVLWRAVVLSSGGLIFSWVLLMTLWMPFINYTKTYRNVAQQMVANLPPDYDCVGTIGVGNGQLASFLYFQNIRFDEINPARCHYYLLQDQAGQDLTSDSLPRSLEMDWTVIWEGRRVSDRDERLRLVRQMRARMQ